MKQGEINHVLVLTDAYRDAEDRRSHCAQALGLAERTASECRARLEAYIESHRGITLKRVSVDQMPLALPEKPVEERGARPACVNAPVNYQQVYVIAGVSQRVMYTRALDWLYSSRGVNATFTIEELADVSAIFQEADWFSATDLKGRKRLIDNFIRRPVRHGVLTNVGKGRYRILRTDWAMY